MAPLRGSEDGTHDGLEGKVRVVRGKTRREGEREREVRIKRQE